MKLIFIYGPPAAGKLTVATELGRITSFAVFDNHLSLDAVLPVFDYGTEQLSRLVEQIRLAVIGEAARSGVDLIFTFVYAHPEDKAYVERICGAAESHGGTVCFVQLACETAAQESRVGHLDRVRRKKINSVDGLRAMHARGDLLAPIPGRESFRIDTTAILPEDAARMIVEHYQLPARERA